jgi:hypothetical protein
MMLGVLYAHQVFDEMPKSEFWWSCRQIASGFMWIDGMNVVGNEPPYEKCLDVLCMQKCQVIWIGNFFVEFKLG